MAEPIQVTRLVYPGAPIVGPARIRAVKVEKSPENSNIDTVRVPNLAHYQSGCRKHAGCFGHYCVTPSGILLPPQSLSMKTGEITTEYLKASKFAFEGRKTEYLSSLESTNFTKNGTMRSIMSTPIAGSARLIATPMWYRRNIVWVSKNLADKLKTCYIQIDEDGIMEPTYKERTLAEGDNIILTRPPPLNIWNTQPMTIRFWDHDCIGVHPETFTMFHGDYDGDEAHIIPLYHPVSLLECEWWTVPSNEKFDEGRADYAANNTVDWLDEDYWNRCEFMNTTTVSSAEMFNDVKRATYGNISRNKDSNLKAMHDRFNTTDTERDFVAQSIRGMKDVCKQQLSQGLIGDMTRVAKIAAMCFTRPATGGLYVVTNVGSRLLCDDGLNDAGVPAVRAIMSLCEVAQQAALDSHRVQESDMASHDFVSDVLLGKPVLEPKGAKLPTLVVFSTQCPSSVISQTDPLWRYAVDDGIVVLCRPQQLNSDVSNYVIGTYNPKILSSISENKKTHQETCQVALTVVANYYGIRLTPMELKDLSYVLSYKVASSPNPITTRRGMLDRSLPWIETMEGTDVTKLQELKTGWQEPFSSTSSMFTSNFSRMVLGETT
jgi:hypothetical protein